MNQKYFDIFVVGGGHAGLEAAWGAHQFDFKVGIGTIPGIGLASTPCNPAIGGVGKGQVVREIDALGGLMGKLADLAGIQYRTLNESKGYAVHSTRVQVDKKLYSQYAEEIIEKSSIEIIKKKVLKISQKNSLFFIYFADSSIVQAQKLIVTTGTFLGGVLHTGEEKSSGGRVGSQASASLDDLFSQVQALPKRFKTGTPARLKKNSICYSVMEAQESDPQTLNFHFAHKLHTRHVKQVCCYLTRTKPKTLSIIRDNKKRSPLFNGQIKGVGPRYCPSIEDKAFRYPDRSSHHVFIEPEGLNVDTVYPNGVSTSLPKDVQEEFYRTIKGLEECQFEAYGYAVEYDVVDTSRLSLSLEHQDIKNLYFAGQVNGTSGYEEAGGQGLIAGINAAFSLLKKEPFILERGDSYIGVMIEDLVTQKRDEPYRLFTARAEGRLFIREDNSIQRMRPYRSLMGLNWEIDKFQELFLKEFEVLTALVKKYSYSVTSLERKRFKSFGYGDLRENIKLEELLKRSHLDPVKTLIQELKNFGADFHPQVVRTVAISTRYSGYIERFQRENRKVQKLARKKINWKRLVESRNISNECRQRVREIRPETFGQLQKINGIRPATLAYVAGSLI